jgi:GT2 family glycosyltransferase
MGDLPDCLEALMKQSYPKDCYEIIVVDNGQNYGIESLVKKYPNVFLVAEVRPGSYIARNTGLYHARGEFIVFTDADCIAHTDFLSSGISVLESDENCGLVGGQIVLQELIPQQPTAVELFEREFTFTQEKYIKKGKQASTANVFTSAEVIKKVGNFDQNLKSTGDFEWSHRISKAGYELFYSPEACVYHPTRRTWKAIAKRTKRIAGGKHDKLMNTGFTVKKFLVGLRRAAFPLGRARQIIGSEKLSLANKIKIFSVMIFVSIIETRERVLLQFFHRVSTRS